MTSHLPRPSHPGSIETRLPRAAFGFFLALTLCLCALPAFARLQPAGVSPLAGAPATGTALSEDTADAVTGQSAVSDSLTLSDRALLLATDFNRLLTPAVLAEVARSEQTPASGKIQGVLQKALALLGTPYRWGGSSPDKGFDCSGLVGYVFRNALGIELPRVSREMAKNGKLISDKALLTAGDLVFFGRKGRVDHVGIYVGEGRFVHAPSRGKDVQVSSLDDGYWGGKFMSARRVDGI